MACPRSVASLIAGTVVFALLPIPGFGIDEGIGVARIDAELGVGRQELSAEENYRRQCAACHGERGRGDGRVARRYNPRPPDFQDPEGIVLLRDDELQEIIASGRASMPAFDEVLSAPEITAVVAYIRVLSGHSEPVSGDRWPST